MPTPRSITLSFSLLCNEIIFLSREFCNIFTHIMSAPGRLMMCFFFLNSAHLAGLSTGNEWVLCPSCRFFHSCCFSLSHTLTHSLTCILSLFLHSHISAAQRSFSALKWIRFEIIKTPVIKLIIIGTQTK